MAWVKKNLIFLIVALVSVGALVFAIFFVSGKMDADKEVLTSLDEAVEQYKALLSRKVHPGNEKVNNIENAKGQIVQMNNFMDEMKEYLKGPEAVTNLNNREFRAYLDTSIAQMRRMAEESGVIMPNTNYWFTFSQYRTTVDFKDNAPGLYAQLQDLKSVLGVLCQARVHSLVALRRVAVNDAEYYGPNEYIGNRYPKTNDFAVTTGYEVTFQGFSSELARVMEGLANAKQCFVVKSVAVAQAPEERKAGPAPLMMQPMQMPMNSSMDRYRMMRGMPPPQPMPMPRAQPSVVKPILDENRLRFTLLVDSVRLKPKPAGQTATQPKAAVAATDAATTPAP
jgi:hypothetical protein